MKVKTESSATKSLHVDMDMNKSIKENPKSPSEAKLKAGEEIKVGMYDSKNQGKPTTAPHQ